MGSFSRGGWMAEFWGMIVFVAGVCGCADRIAGCFRKAFKGDDAWMNGKLMSRTLCG